MIHRTRGNILNQDADALVNTVNCVGVMGRGVALQFRRAFEDNYKAYHTACVRRDVRPGRMLVFERTGLEPPRWIINFPTKRHWKAKSRLEDIQTGLMDLVRVIREKDIRSIALPPLGCGLGGLDWTVVRPLIEEALSSLADVEVFLFEPGATPTAREMINRTHRPRLTKPKAALLGLMESYLAGLMDVSVTLLEVQKLMYLLEEAGEPLNLQFAKGLYGPYAPRLSHMISDMEGHYILGYGDGGDTPDKPIELVEGAAQQGRALLEDHPETLERFHSVNRLIAGFESSYGMELLTTVHWVASREGADALDQAIRKVHTWNERKTMFTPFEIGASWDRLHQLGWLNRELATKG